MKAIHLVTDEDELRPFKKHIQIKFGYAYATSGYACIKMPVKEIFGDELIQPNEEFYIDATWWQRFKFYNASRITRDGLTFTAYDKKLIPTGSLVATPLKDIQFTYPDVNSIFPNSETVKKAVDVIGFNPYLLKQTCDAFGVVDKKKFVFDFYGKDRCIVITNVESKSKAIIMPCVM